MRYGWLVVLVSELLTGAALGGLLVAALKAHGAL